MRRAITAATQRLAAITDTPRLDAELLMAHVRGVSRNDLLLRHLDDPVPAGFELLVERRLAREPVAYITGRRDFWTISLAVGPGVLIPRPDSETLIEAAVDHFGARAPATILDLGTGPGTLLLAALAQCPEAQGVGIDASATALDYAARNARDLRFADRASFRAGNWAQGVEGRFDLILCNPPYIEASAALPPEVGSYEPHEALFAGADGLDDYRVIATQLPGLLAPDGMAAIEIGSTQAQDVTALFVAQGLSVSVRRDLGNRDRCLVVTP